MIYLLFLCSLFSSLLLHSSAHKGAGPAPHPTGPYTQRQYTHQSGVHLIIYIKGMIAAGRYKINPRRRSLLHHRCYVDSKLRSSILQTVTFENVLPRLGVQLPSGLVPSMLFKRPPTRGQAGKCTRMYKNRCKDKHYFRTTKEILEKITFCRVFIDFLTQRLSDNLSARMWERRKK